MQRSQCWGSIISGVDFLMMFWENVIMHKSVSMAKLLMVRLSRYWSGELECLNGDLRPKLHPCFYGISLLILRRKSLAQSFLAFSRSYKVTRFWIHRKWRHTGEFTKHLTPGFLYFSKFLWRRNLEQSFMVFATISQELRGTAKFGVIKLHVDVSGVIQPNGQA